MMETSALSEQRRLLLQDLLSGEAARHRRPGEVVEPRAPGASIPASAEQSHVWLHASMAPGMPLYNEAITIHRHGPFDLEALEKAFNEILRRHEMWRTSLELRDGALQAVVDPDLRLSLPFVDLTDLPEGERDAAAVRIATEDARQPLDLNRAPLLRAKVVRLAPDRHRLYLTLHHIIFDGVAIYRLLMPELAALYDAYARRAQPSLPEPRLQYADYAIWRERQLAKSGMERELAYWREKLSGELPELKLPADHRPPAVPTYRGSMETFHLSPELTAALKTFSRQEGVTLYATLLTAFKALLHRYSGQDDLVIGGVTDMRRRPELEGVIGYFLNSVALRTAPASGLSFRDYLRQVQGTVVEALDASNLPFDRVVREIRPSRVAGRHPLFQVLFSIEPPAPAFAKGWSLTQMDVIVGTAKFDLYLELDEERDRIIGRFLYSTDLFEAPTIRRMIGHWKTLLRGAMLAPVCALGSLPLLTPEEQREILIERNTTGRDYPRITLHGWIEAQARRTPDAIAIECDGRRWRYRDLDRRVGELACALREAGAGRATLVGLAMERTPDMVAGLLAILRLGASYLPLDPALPEARLALLLEDARPAVILADDAAAARLPRSAARIVRASAATRLADSAEVSAELVGPDDLAYVLYTSGSTGRSKAVEIRHRSVVNLLAAMQDELSFDAADSLVAVTTLSFDIAALELFLPLVSGGRLVIASVEDATDPSRLAALIAASGCTTMQATPATWRGLIVAGWRGDARLKLLCGGEALTPDLAAALIQRCGKLWNVYGPTETTIWSLVHRVQVAGEEAVPIGKPLANTRIYIVDPNGAPVPDLVAGELMIGGEGVAAGYRNDPALTAGKFVRFASLGGERLYRTGDVARYRGDGTIEFLGRADNQVKIRGFRVGLEEIESAIAADSRIAACAVRALPDASGEMSLTAYLAGPQLRETVIPVLRTGLRAALPAYMVPTNYVVLPELPMTPNGKVDRKRLPELEGARAAAECVEPRDELEARLASLWQNVLGVSKIGIHDDFFDLGGHSLLASMLIANIQEILGRELPLVALFRAPTIAALAELLRSQDELPFSHLVPLRENGTGRPLFIVHGIFGNVLQLKDLAERVETTRPVYAIQARGVDPKLEPHRSVAEMVAAYIAAIRTVQPAGPYALAGYSFGGLVAYEMACRLQSHGKTVDLLAMLETDLCAGFLPWPHKLAYKLLFVSRVIGKARTLPRQALVPYLRKKLRELMHQSLWRIGLRFDFVEPDSLTGAMSERYRAMFQIGLREFKRFNPKRYDGKLSLFRTKAPRFDACDPLPIWRRVATSVELFEVDGAHATIMDKPYVDTLAAQLTRCLAGLEMRSAQSAAFGAQRRSSGNDVATLAANLLEDGTRGAVLQGGG